MFASLIAGAAAGGLEEPIEEIWSLDMVNQGDSAVLNKGVLGENCESVGAIHVSVDRLHGGDVASKTAVLARSSSTQHLIFCDPTPNSRLVRQRA